MRIARPRFIFRDGARARVVVDVEIILSGRRLRSRGRLVDVHRVRGVRECGGQLLLFDGTFLLQQVWWLEMTPRRRATPRRVIVSLEYRFVFDSCKN